jgi:RNA polymerase sigma-70 factor (ECF subfamily)
VTEIDDQAFPAGKEDEWLAVRWQLGERAAFDELIERYQGPLWRYVRRVAPDEDAAREVTQDAWLRVIRGIGRLRDPDRLRPWLFGIARRALMDRLRDQYARAVETDCDVTEIPARVDSALPELQLQQVERELAALPIVEREVLTLFYLKELSLGEVAEVLNLPVGTVKSRLFRARQMLRGELTAKGELQ